MGIQLTNIRKTFGAHNSIEVLKGITAEIKTGEMVSIMGRSGSGKSTLLYIMSSLDQPSAGEVSIDNKSLQSLDTKELHQFRNLKMGFVFQFHHLLPELTALENILMPTIKKGTQRQQTQFAKDLLGEFGILSMSDKLPSQLSGGEQQRVAIARALVMKPTYIFADEPTGNLDSVNGQAVINLFRRINKDFGTTVIYVTHDLEFSRMASRQIQIVDGQIV